MNPDRVLVTGASGLIGRGIFEHLRELQVDVHGVSRRAGESARSNAVDLSDPEAAATLVSRIAPNAIVHVAGGHVAGWEGLRAANVQTAVNVMNAAARLAVPPRVVLAGSSAEYGQPVSGLISESSPTEPVTDYGRVKLEATEQARTIAAASGIPLCVVRPFNIVSPDLPAASALGNMRRQLVDGKGGRRVVRCGRLDVVRDFVPLNVVLMTLSRLLEVDRWPTALNVCSGRAVILGDLLTSMAHAIDVEVQVEVEPELAAMAAADRIVGDPTRLHEMGVVCAPTLEFLAELMMHSRHAQVRRCGF